MLSNIRRVSCSNFQHSSTECRLECKLFLHSGRSMCTLANYSQVMTISGHTLRSKLFRWMCRVNNITTNTSVWEYQRVRVLKDRIWQKRHTKTHISLWRNGGRNEKTRAILPYSLALVHSQVFRSRIRRTEKIASISSNSAGGQAFPSWHATFPSWHVTSWRVTVLITHTHTHTT